MTPNPPTIIGPEEKRRRELIDKGNDVAKEMVDLKLRADGIAYTPKRMREARLEEFAARSRELRAELDAIEKELNEERQLDPLRMLPGDA